MKQPLILLSLLLAFSCDVIAQMPAWQPIGTGDDANKSTFAEVTKTAVITVGSDIYIAYSDKQVGYKLTVRKNNAGLWSDVGTPGLSNGAVDNVNMVADALGTIYLAYYDNSLTNNLVVKRLSGSSWVDVGAASLPTGPLKLPALAVSPTGIPYVSYIDPLDNDRVSVAKFENGNWALVGAQSVSLPYAYHTDIAIDGNGIVYMNYAEGINMDDIYIRKFDGSTWSTITTLTSSNSSTTVTYNPDMLVDANNRLYLLYRNQSSGRAMLTRYDGTSWATVGSAEFSAGVSTSMKLAIAPSGTVYAAYEDGSLNKAVVVKYFDGNNWQATGDTRAIQTSSLSLTTDNSNAPILFHNNWFLNSGLVWRHSAGNWEIIGAKGFAGTTVGSACGVMDTAGMPIVGYSDALNGYKPTILKYINGNWSPYTSVLFSDTTAYDVYLAMSANNTLYAAYRDYRLSKKMTVKKFNGSGWDTVGLPGFAVVGDYTSFHLDHNGVPYVTSQNPLDYWRATVWKFDGNAWVRVGNAGLSPDKVFDISMTTDNSNNVYVAYRNLYGGSFLVVKKFDGNTWSDLGFTAVADGVLPSVAVDNNGDLFVAYMDASFGYRLTVRRYAGGSWSVVGGAGTVSAGSASGLMLTMKKGVPFVSYLDTDQGYVGMIKTIDGNNWVNVGSNSISIKGTSTLMPAHWKDKTIVVYTNVDGFAKELIVPENINGTRSKSVLSLSIWPNPASDELNVLCPVAATKTVAVYGVDGKLHFRRELDATTNSVAVATDSWPRGLYIVCVVSKGEASSHMISLE